MKHKTFSQTGLEWHLCDVEINSRGKKNLLLEIYNLDFDFVDTQGCSELQFLFINNRQECEVHLNQEEKGQ